MYLNQIRERVKKDFDQKQWSGDIERLMQYAELIKNSQFAYIRERWQQMYERQRSIMIEKYGKIVMKGL